MMNYYKAIKNNRDDILDDLIERGVPCPASTLIYAFDNHIDWALDRLLHLNTPITAKDVNEYAAKNGGLSNKLEMLVNE